MLKHLQKTVGTLLCGAALLAGTAVHADVAEQIQHVAQPVSGEEEQEWTTLWKERITQKMNQVEREGNDIRLVLIGDSITHNWENFGKSVCDKEFGRYHPLNLGFSGCRTQHTLWIIEKTNIWKHIQPKLIVLMIGTNNLGSGESGVEATATAIERCVNSLRKQAPQAKILLYGIFPNCRNASHPNRARIAGVNGLIKNLADGKNVFYEDITDKLLEPDGYLSPKIMPDALHPSAEGYKIWAESIKPYAEEYADRSFFDWFKNLF